LLAAGKERRDASAAHVHGAAQKASRRVLDQLGQPLAE